MDIELREGMNLEEFRKQAQKINLVLLDPTLDDEDRKIFMSRWGIFFTKPKSLKELADEYGYCIETIRKKEIKVMKKIQEYFGDCSSQ